MRGEAGLEAVLARHEVIDRIALAHGAFDRQRVGQQAGLQPAVGGVRETALIGVDPIAVGEIIEIADRLIAGRRAQELDLAGAEAVADQGLSFRDYLARRPAALRNTFRRNSARLAAAGAVRFALVQDRGALADALACYEQVYAASWKRSEPYPAFMRRLAAGLAAAGALRLGLLHVDERPVAAQIWLVQRGRAILYKLAHDQAFDAFSPGTVLTMRMLERLLDEQHVTEFDLGGGDDPYKRLWATRRRERVGLVAFDPLTWRGALGALRHVAGRLRNRAFRSVTTPLPVGSPEPRHLRSG